MRITAVLNPVANWPAIEEAIHDADGAGLSGVGLCGNWPADPSAVLGTWAAAGVSHAAVSIGAQDMPARIKRLARAAAR